MLMPSNGEVNAFIYSAQLSHGRHAQWEITAELEVTHASLDLRADSQLDAVYALEWWISAVHSAPRCNKFVLALT